MKKILLSAFVTVLCATQLHAQQHITDLALIAGNVKYYYPNKDIKPADWNKLSAYIIQSWQVDSHTIKPPQNLYKDITDKYAEAGLNISLYQQKPNNTDSSTSPKGKHWEYVGYGYSKNRYMLGPFAWAYNLFANPYGKALKANDADYYNRMNGSEVLTYTNTELIIQLHDKLWLGLPLSGEKQKQSEAFKNFKASKDEKALSLNLTYLIDAWNLFYHFCPTVEEKQVWLQRFSEVVNDVSQGGKLYFAFKKLCSYTNDAHTNFAASYVVPGSFYKIDSKYYYKEPKNDTSTGNLWQVLLYKGEKPEEVYSNNLLRVATPSSEAKTDLALRTMRIPLDTSSIELQVRDVMSGKTQTLNIHGRRDFSNPGDEYSHGKSVLADSAKGIYYLDLKKVRGSKIVGVLKSAKCKSMIIDCRGHGYIGNNKYLQLLINDTCTRVNMVTPKYRYPEKSLLSYDTILSYVYPGKQHIDKPVVLLCDEYTISSSETILAALQDYSHAIVIGRTSMGTTGNVVMAPVYYNNKIYDALPFTPTLALDKTGNRMNGIVPDIHVTKTLENIQHNEDEIFDAAMKYLQKEIK